MSPQTAAHFRSKVTTAAEAFRMIKPGDRIVTAMAAAEPQLFFQQLCQSAKSLKDVTIYCANPQADYQCFVDPSLEGCVDFIVMFLTAAVRNHQGHGTVHYMPQHLSRWSKSILSQGEIDVFWGSCTPPDARGFVSVGLGAAYESEIIRRAKKVILEVNHHMPLVFGDTLVAVSQVDALIENHHPLPLLSPEQPSSVDIAIGENVASLVKDGSTIQLGIGAIPNAVGIALMQKSNLGIHTELITDSMRDLFEAGVVNGREKTLFPGQIIGTFIYGTQALYDFVHQNPLVQLLPASYVNDPYVIGQNKMMTSINSAVEVDFTGQVVSESIGHREISGIGGAFDTHTGAQRSVGGRGIIAIPSLTAKGESKIVTELKPGAKVTIGRNDVDTIVTEFGIAHLAGKSVAQRVKSLAAIAHPNFRDELLSSGRRLGYL